jgi:hypothetical protein
MTLSDVSLVVAQCKKTYHDHDFCVANYLVQFHHQSVKFQVPDFQKGELSCPTFLPQIVLGAFLGLMPSYCHFISSTLSGVMPLIDLIGVCNECFPLFFLASDGRVKVIIEEIEKEGALLLVDLFSMDRKFAEHYSVCPFMLPNCLKALTVSLLLS